MSDLEVLTVGRVSVDIYAEQRGVPMTEVSTFRKSIGGTSTNVAVAAARLGHRVATATRVGDDEFGAYVKHALEHTFGVDTRFVGTDPELKTPLAFAELDPPEDPNIIFYREPAAPATTCFCNVSVRYGSTFFARISCPSAVGWIPSAWLRS